MHPKFIQANRICERLNDDLWFMSRLADGVGKVELDDDALFAEIMKRHHAELKYHRVICSLYPILETLGVKEKIDVYWASNRWVKQAIANHIRVHYRVEFAESLIDALYQDLHIGYMLLATLHKQGLLTPEMVDWALNHSKDRRTRRDAKLYLRSDEKDEA